MTLPHTAATMNQPQRTLVPALALVVLTAALTACGGTSSGTPSAGTPAPASPVGFTGTLDGTLSSLSGSGFTVGAQSVSLALSGLALQVQTATTVTVNGDASSSEVLAAGQDVHVVVSNGVASQVEVRIEVRGRVDAVDVTGGTLTVAGRRWPWEPAPVSASGTPKRSRTRPPTRWRTSRRSLRPWSR